MQPLHCLSSQQSEFWSHNEIHVPHCSAFSPRRMHIGSLRVSRAWRDLQSNSPSEHGFNLHRLGDDQEGMHFGAFIEAQLPFNNFVGDVGQQNENNFNLNVNSYYE